MQPPHLAGCHLEKPQRKEQTGRQVGLALGSPSPHRTALVLRPPRGQKQMEVVSAGDPQGVWEGESRLAGRGQHQLVARDLVNGEELISLAKGSPGRKGWTWGGGSRILWGCLWKIYQNNTWFL